MQDNKILDAADANFRQVVEQVLNFWFTEVRDISQFFEHQEEPFFTRPVAPGRNSGMHLFAHLVATHDSLFPMLGIGERIYPELAPFLHEAESAIAVQVTLADLHNKWNVVNTALERSFRAIPAEGWLDRHMNVSPEDFVKAPMRNKLNVLISRAAHQRYHKGQLVFLNEKLAPTVQ